MKKIAAVRVQEEAEIIQFPIGVEITKKDNRDVFASELELEKAEIEEEILKTAIKIKDAESSISTMNDGINGNKNIIETISLNIAELTELNRQLAERIRRNNSSINNLRKNAQKLSEKNSQAEGLVDHKLKLLRELKSEAGALENKRISLIAQIEKASRIIVTVIVDEEDIICEPEDENAFNNWPKIFEEIFNKNEDIKVISLKRAAKIISLMRYVTATPNMCVDISFDDKEVERIVLESLSVEEKARILK